MLTFFSHNVEIASAERLASIAVCKSDSHEVVRADDRLGHFDLAREYAVSELLAARIPEVAVEYVILRYVESLCSHLLAERLSASLRDNVVLLTREYVQLPAAVLVDEMLHYAADSLPVVGEGGRIVGKRQVERHHGLAAFHAQVG